MCRETPPSGAAAPATPAAARANSSGLLIGRSVIGRFSVFIPLYQLTALNRKIRGACGGDSHVVKKLLATSTCTRLIPDPPAHVLGRAAFLGMR